MQTELDGVSTPVAIDIIGVNAIGLEVGNPTITMDRSLPWLQDVPEEDVWTSWQATWRDVIVLDAAGNFVAVFNLTQHDLSKPTEYEALKTLLVSTANGP
jgi:hypothetical protein